MSNQSVNCTQPEIELHLSDYFTGHLDKEKEEQVRHHLNNCKSCRTSLRLMSNISGKYVTAETLVSDEHFSPQLLGRYYSNPISLDIKLKTQIENHLKQCQECAADISFLQESDSNLRMIIQTQSNDSNPSSLWSWLKKFIRK